MWFNKIISRSVALAFVFFFTNWSVLWAQSPSDSPIIWTARWNPLNDYMVYGKSDGEVRIMNPGGQSIKQYDVGEGIMRLEWHPLKPELLLVGAAEDYSCVINTDTDEIFPLEGVQNGARGSCWSPDGKRIAAGDGEGRILMLDSLGHLLNTIELEKGNTRSVVSLDWHPTEDRIVATKGHIWIFDSSGKVLNKVRHREEDVLMLCVEWHPSGEFFVLGDYGAEEVGHKPELQFRDKEGALIKTLHGVSKAEYRNVRWSHDGSMLATASDGIRIWTKDGTLIHESKSGDLLWGIDWKNDGQMLITSSAGGHIVLWLQDGTQAFQIR